MWWAFLALVWLWYLQEPFAVLVIAAVIMAFAGDKTGSSIDGLYRSCGVASLVWTISEGAPYVDSFASGPYITMYVCVFARIAGYVDAAYNGVSRLELREAIHSIRRILYMMVMAACACMAIYYIVVISDIRHGDLAESTWPPAPGLRVNCTAMDAKDDQDTKLYDSTPFTTECSFIVWERFRTNALVALQVTILWLITVQVPYEVRRRRAKVTYVFASLLKCFLLFVSVTILVDDIEEWYIMGLSVAIMLSCAVAVHYGIDIYTPRREDDDLLFVSCSDSRVYSQRLAL